MRVLVVTNVFPPGEHGGYELSCQAFVEDAGNQHDVRVLTTSRGDEHRQSTAKVAVDRVLKWYRRPDGSFASPSWLDRYRLERWNRAAFLRAVRDFDPDVVMWWNMGGLSLSLIEVARRKGLPAVGVVCDYWMIWAPAADPWLRAGRRARWGAAILERLGRVPMRVDFDGAARWVFVSEHVRRETINVIGRLARTEVVHTGIAVGRFDRAPRDRVWSGRLLMVGRATHNKGVDIALDALAQLPGCTLDIYGRSESRERTAIEERVAELRIGDRVALHPHIEQGDIQHLYAQYDALLFPVRWDEPWGRAPLEAMASGVAVIAAARGGAREYLENQINCLVAFDAEEVRAAVARLASDPELRARLVRAGRITAERYDISRANYGRERALHAVLGECKGLDSALSEPGAGIQKGSG